jgi:hypothetical protein
MNEATAEAERRRLGVSHHEAAHAVYAHRIGLGHRRLIRRRELEQFVQEHRVGQ